MGGTSIFPGTTTDASAGHAGRSCQERFGMPLNERCRASSLPRALASRLQRVRRPDLDTFTSIRPSIHQATDVQDSLKALLAKIPAEKRGGARS